MPRTLGHVTISLAVVILLPSLAHAQTVGSIRGTVSDTAGRALPDAIIHVNDTRLGAIADSAGRFRIGGLPPGAYVVRVAKIGFRPESTSVAIATGESTREFTLHVSSTVLGRVVVSAQRLGETQAAALDRRQNAANIVNALAGDVIRSLPTLNAAEAAGRIPGVTTERDEGEGKFVQIRGTEPRLTNVTIDGAHIPGTEQGNRVPKLDDVPSDILGAIEVSKTLTAEMDADAIGGSVNLVSKTPTGDARGYVSGQFGQMQLLSRTQYQGGFAYGGRFGEGQRLGFLIGGSADHNNRSISDLEPAWAVDASGRSYPIEWSQRPYSYRRNRYGLGGDLDYRFESGATLFLRGLYSKFENFGTTFVSDVTTGVTGSTFGSSGDSASSGAHGFGTGAEVTREAYVRTPIEQMYGVTTGGSTQLGRFLMKVSANFAGTSQSERDYRFSPFVYDGPNGQGLTVAYDGSNQKVPTFQYATAAMASAVNDPANFGLSHYFTVDGNTSGGDVGGAVDLSTPWHAEGTDWSSLFKFGAKVRDETKRFTSNRGFWFTNSSIPLSIGPNGFSDPTYYHYASSAFTLGPLPDEPVVRAYENAHAAEFVNASDTVRDVLATFSGAEHVYSLYASNTFSRGPVDVYVGLRMENTQVSYTGHEVTKDTSGAATGISTVPGSKGYTDLFPSVQLKFSLGSGSDARIAVTRGIARPNYSQLAPSLSGTPGVNKSNPGNLRSGNPDLRPQHAWNYDLLVEHFFPSVGVISGGVFYKQITDYIFDKQFVYSGPATQFLGQAGTRPENGGSGHLLGLEAEWQQRFTFLPGSLGDFGMDLNWTHLDSRVLVDPSSGRQAPMTRQSPDLENAALTFDEVRVSGRLQWSYQGANIVSYGDGTPTANGDAYFYAHSQIDASVLVNISNDVQLQLQGLNLNNAVFGFFTGTPSQDFAIQREYYGPTLYLGIKYGR